MKIRLVFLYAVLLMLILSSCSTPRKCNGQIGTRVPMGIM